MFRSPVTFSGLEAYEENLFISTYLNNRYVVSIEKALKRDNSKHMHKLSELNYFKIQHENTKIQVKQQHTHIHMSK